MNQQFMGPISPYPNTGSGNNITAQYPTLTTTTPTRPMAVNFPAAQRLAVMSPADLQSSIHFSASAQNHLNFMNASAQFYYNGNIPGGLMTSSPHELEHFAEKFKQRRIKLGVTQSDVGQALGKLKIPGVGNLSQSTICRFESLTLSHNNMIALKPVLTTWLEKAEASAQLAKKRQNSDHKDVEKSPDQINDRPKEFGDNFESDFQNGRKRKRTSIAAPEKRALEKLFEDQPRPSSEKIAQIAEKLELRKNVVRVWFCNQRQKRKRLTSNGNGQGRVDSNIKIETNNDIEENTNIKSNTKMPKLAPTSPILHSDHSSSGNETNLNNTNSNNSNSNCSDSNSSPSEIKMILCQPEIKQQPADFQNNISNQPSLEILEDISKTENNSQILHRYNDPLTSILSFDSQDNFDYDRHLTSGSRNNYFELDGGFNDSIPY